MAIEPVMTRMQPVFIGSQQEGMTSVSFPGPKIQPSAQSSIAKAQSFDPSLYSANSVRQARANPIDRNTGIKLSELSSSKAKSDTERMIAQGFMNHLYGGRIYP